MVTRSKGISFPFLSPEFCYVNKKKKSAHERPSVRPDDEFLLSIVSLLNCKKHSLKRMLFVKGKAFKYLIFSEKFCPQSELLIRGLEVEENRHDT